ncbi:MAG: response regulator [Verrucomicrobiales bacterium]|nr:response regulator [Verrucomicrobiales bacterium]
MARILIIDDERGIRQTLGAFLVGDGHEVRLAECGESARQLLKSGTFDVVLLDLMLPNVTGLELVAEVVKSAPKAQVVVLTGEPNFETARDAMRAGAVDYLSKPVDKASILRAVRQAIRFGELLEEKRRLEEERQRYRENLEVLVGERTRSLEESRRFLSDLIECSGALVFVKDIDGRYEFVNRQWERVTGLRREEVLGRLDGDIFPATVARRFQENDRRVLREGQTIEAEEVLGTDAEARVFLSIKFPVRHADGGIRGLCGMATEITERLRMEGALRESEAQLRRAQEVAHVGSWSLDLASGRLVWSEETCNIFGIPPGGPITQELFFEHVHSKDVEMVRQSWSAALKHKPFDIEHRIVVNGQSRWVRQKARLEFDADGQPATAIGTVQDISERKQVEAQFLRAQRLESIGSLSGGLAHDLNNILAPILLAGPLLRRDRSSSGELEALDLIENCAKRGAELIRQLLAFSRGTEGERVSIRWSLLLRETINMLRETLPRSIAVEVAVDENLWSVVGDPTQLQQVLMNLAVNARDAMPDGGTLRLAVGNVQLEIAPSWMPAGAEPGKYVRLTVSDTGQGIDPEIADKIFDPFFTTKPAGRGTGLGLPTVVGIVKGHGGHLNYTSESGRGTTFEVYLRAGDRSVPEPKPAMSALLPSGRGECVLVVDDEPSLRRVVTSLLERHGYRAIAVDDGHQAMELLQRDEPEVSLVITDLMMPGIDGLALARWIRGQPSGPRIIVVTGVMEWSGASDTVESLRQLGVDAVVRKPFELAELVATVSRVLQGPPDARGGTAPVQKSG